MSDFNEKGCRQCVPHPRPLHTIAETALLCIRHAHGGTRASASDASSDSSSDDDDDDEDETAALLRELEKIKRERAEEKARQERERAEMQQATREEEIALGNPLLNLENALRGGQQGGAGSTAGEGAGGFGVKRRWDDDVIFKNQAAGADGGDKGGFINDLTRACRGVASWPAYRRSCSLHFSHTFYLCFALDRLRVPQALHATICKVDVNTSDHTNECRVFFPRRL